MSEPTRTVTAEGRTLEEAIRNAAALLGADPATVEHEIDRDHFRNENGRSVGRDTVKVVAWVRDPEETAGARDARDWVVGLLEAMGLRGEVRVRVEEPRVVALTLHSPDARHFVGRRGARLRAILTLLEAAMARRHPEWEIRLDVEGGSQRAAEPRRNRKRSRGRAEGAGGGARRERELDRLRQLARRLAREVAEKGQPVEIRKQLNSFERHVVHKAVAEIEGVTSESVGEGPQRRVRIKPAS